MLLSLLGQMFSGSSGNLFGNIGNLGRRMMQGWSHEDPNNPMSYFYGTDDYNKAMDRWNMNFRQQEFDYNKALQQTLFDREDTSLQRSVNDARGAGLSPLAGLNGAGAGQAVSVGSSDVNSSSPTGQNPLAMLSLMQQLKTGQEQQNVLRAQASEYDARTAYQEAVTDYFKKHGTLPTTDDKTMSYIMQFLGGLTGQDVTPNTVGSLIKSVIDKNQGALDKPLVSSFEPKFVENTVTDTGSQGKADSSLSRDQIAKINETKRVGLVAKDKGIDGYIRYEIKEFNNVKYVKYIYPSGKSSDWFKLYY